MQSGDIVLFSYRTLRGLDATAVNAAIDECRNEGEVVKASTVLQETVSQLSDTCVVKRRFFSSDNSPCHAAESRIRMSTHGPRSSQPQAVKTIIENAHVICIMVETLSNSEQVIHALLAFECNEEKREASITNLPPLAGGLPYRGLCP